jgi:NTP pyrophosphatase (non-canonical NTP hydrolase)
MVKARQYSLVQVGAKESSAPKDGALVARTVPWMGPLPHREGGAGVKPEYEPHTVAAKLGYLVEECGEVLAAVGKTQRWGLESYNPELPVERRETNRDWILRELNDLEGAIARVRGALMGQRVLELERELAIKQLGKVVSTCGPTHQTPTGAWAAWDTPMRAARLQKERDCE